MENWYKTMACVTFRRGRWCLDYYDNEGKRHVKTLPDGTTKTRAKEILRGIEDQLSKGSYLPEKKVPFFRDVGADWLEHKKANVRESTWNMYRGHLTLHFETVNRMRISHIRIADVERFITIHQEKGMNLSTMRKLIITFNQVMSYAVRHRYTESNPVRDAERPRDKGSEQTVRIRILTPEEIRAFLSAAKNPKYRTLFMLAVMSGARQGELLGLKWQDVDWQEKQIHIQRTFNHGKWYKPKSRNSDRRIDIGPEMSLELKKWKLQCPPNEQGLMFPSKNGNPITQTAMIRRYFFPALKAAGLPRIRFHDLRHTYCKSSHSTGGKHQIHTVPDGTFIPNGYSQRVCPSYETVKSGIRTKAGDHRV